MSGVVLLGEQRPHHAAAIAAAKARGIPVYAVEMGYLRPDWIRLERSGSGYNSHFPCESRNYSGSSVRASRTGFQGALQAEICRRKRLTICYSICPTCSCGSFFPTTAGTRSSIPWRSTPAGLDVLLKGPARKWRRSGRSRRGPEASAAAAASASASGPAPPRRECCLRSVRRRSRRPGEGHFVLLCSSRFSQLSRLAAFTDGRAVRVLAS